MGSFPVGGGLLRVQGSRFKVQGSEFKVESSKFDRTVACGRGPVCAPDCVQGMGVRLAMLHLSKAADARNGTTYPLFDTDRFRRHIEAAYVTMWERYQRGEPPESFEVQPIQRVMGEG